MISQWIKPCLLHDVNTKAKPVLYKKTYVKLSSALRLIFQLRSHSTTHCDCGLWAAVLKEWLAKGYKIRAGTNGFYTNWQILDGRNEGGAVCKRNSFMECSKHTTFKLNTWCCTPYRMEVNANFRFFTTCLDRKSKKVHWFWELMNSFLVGCPVLTKLLLNFFCSGRHSGLPSQVQ